jgi:hypothetical protein
MKIIRYQRAKRQPLPSFEEKLARVDVLATRYFKNVSVDISRDIDVTHMALIDVTVWIVPAPTEKDPNKVRFIKQILLPTPLDKPSLLVTPYGRVCPHCQTNEYLRSILDFHTTQVKDQNWRMSSDLNQYCVKCNRYSVDGSEPVLTPRITKARMKKFVPIRDYTQSNW